MPAWSSAALSAWRRPLRRARHPASQRLTVSGHRRHRQHRPPLSPRLRVHRRHRVRRPALRRRARPNGHRPNGYRPRIRPYARRPPSNRSSLLPRAARRAQREPPRRPTSRLVGRRAPWLSVAIMDFAMSAKAHDYHKRLTEFMTESCSRPRTPTTHYRAANGTRRPHRSAGRRGAEEAGQGARAVEPVPAVGVRADQPGVRAAGRAVRVEHRDRARRPSTAPHRTPATWRCCTCSPPSEQQQAVAGAAAGRRDPQRVLDDRAGGRLQRRPQHRDRDRPRRRRLRHQRPQVVDVGRIRPALQDPDRDGPHQSRRREPPAAVDGPGADGHARRQRSCGPRRCSAGRTSTGTPRSIYDNVRVPASNLLGEEGIGLRDRPGPAGPGPHPPLHAGDRAWPSGRWH